MPVQVKDLAAWLVKRPGIPLRQVSARFGFADSWASNTMRKKDPHVSTVVELAEISDLKLALIDKHDSVVELIEPDGHERPAE